MKNGGANGHSDLPAMGWAVVFEILGRLRKQGGGGYIGGYSRELAKCSPS